MHLPWKRCKRVKVTSSRERISSRNAMNLCFFSSGTENVKRSVCTRCPRKMRRRVGTETHLAMCKKYPSWVRTVAATKKAQFAASKLEVRAISHPHSSPRCLSSMYWEQGTPSSRITWVATIPRV